MAWLSGWDKRIELAIGDYAGDIGAEVTWFPVTVFLTSTQAEEVFVELTTDIEFLKVAFTKADGETELFGDCELFDVSEELGIYHVSRDGWTINANTTIYIYYDADHADNATYISKTATSGSQYPTAHTDDYVKSTTKFSTLYWAYYATDPVKLLTGDKLGQEWMSANTAVTNQRFHIDLGSAKIINKIYYENSHESGADTDKGVQNFTFQGSNTGAGTFDDLVYANDEGWTNLATSQSTFDEHVGADQADPKYITVTNTTAYRYYAFKFADNHGDAIAMAMRHIVLQRTVAAESVWDSNFKAVYHMNDDTTSTILDSTSNNNNGTKKAANEPIETTTAKVNKAQDFDGTDDWISIADANDLHLSSGTFSIEVVLRNDYDLDGIADDALNDDNIICKQDDGDVGKYAWVYKLDTGNDKQQFAVFNPTDNLAMSIFGDKTAWDVDTWYYLAIVFNGTNHQFFVDGADDGTNIDNTMCEDNAGQLAIGKKWDSTPPQAYDGKICEIRISITSRAAAWIKGTYNSLWDTLFTYGSEEEAEVTANTIFFGCNF